MRRAYRDHLARISVQHYLGTAITPSRYLNKNRAQWREVRGVEGHCLVIGDEQGEIVVLLLHLYCAMVSIYGPAAVNKLPKLSFLLYGQLWPQLSKLLYLLIPDNFFRAISSVRNGSTVITLNCMKFRFRFRVYLKLLQNSQPLFKSPNIDKVVRIPKNSDIQNFQKLICDHDLLETVIKQPQ